MEMTIAEPIQTLEYLRDSGVFPFSSKEGMLYTVESIDAVIETMRKYQKIGQIVSDDYYLSDYNKIKDIKGVIDGKID